MAYLTLTPNINYIRMKLTALSTLGMASLLTIMSSCTQSLQKADYQVIPLPNEIVSVKETPFKLRNGIIISYPSAEKGMKENAEFLADYVKQETGIILEPKADATGKKMIRLATGLASENPEAYRMKVNGGEILIEGASDAGVFYGIQTLRKSLPANQKSIEMPAAEINDAPRLSYRGMMLDVSRHFYSADSIKRYIDILAMHNINRFHWHLTDDQGWRIEIKKHPKLAEQGSIRKETVIGRNSGEYDGKEYGRGAYYTQEQIKEIIKYADERHITIIPEIDLPGHMLAALSIYPDMGCTGGPYAPWTQWGVSDDVLCAGNDKTYEFITDVLNEVIDLFPSEYIHVGGDECPKTRWAKCPKCQAKIKSLGLKAENGHTKEERLQSHVIRFAESVVSGRGRKMIGWDETLEGGLAPNATVMSWRGMKGGIEAAKLGHDAIMTPTDFCYFDYYQDTDTETEPLAIGGYLPLEKVYSFEPVAPSLTPEEAKFIVGAQANLWVEYIPTFSHVEYMVLPRMAALAEVAWTQPEKKNLEDFKQRLLSLMNHYDAYNFNYAKHLYNVSTLFEPNSADKCIDVTLTTVDNADIYYTLDGTTPTKASAKYNNVIKVSQDAELQAVAIRANGQSKVFKENILFNKATAKKITMNTEINKQYQFNGAITLVDGLQGNRNYKTGRWIAFVNKDMEAVIDMEEPTEISSLQVNTNVNWGDWIMDARGMSIEISEDGNSFREIASAAYPATKFEERNERNGIQNHTLSFEPVSARFIKVKMASEKSMPEWHGGKGKPSFLFVDEIIVR